MRMLTYFINRGGKNLSEARHAELEKAKGLLSQIIAKEKDKEKSKAAPKKAAKTRSSSRSSTKHAA